MCTCVETINEMQLVKARKDYEDSCRWFIMDCLSDLRKGEFHVKNKMTFKGWRLIAESIRDGWVIRKGSLHEHSVNKMDGAIYSFRNKPGLHKLCCKFDLYPEC